MSLTEAKTEDRAVETEEKPYTPPVPAPDVAWLTRARAAEAMGVSRTTLGHAARQGKVISRVDGGIRYFAVGAGAAKAILSAKKEANEGRIEQAVVEAFAAGAPVMAIVAELRCSPRTIARTLKDLESALATAERIYQQQRDIAEAQRTREIETGHPDVPTTWAWCDFLFKDPAMYTFSDAKKKFDAWLEAGGKLEAASPHVRQALESAEAWTVARRTWLGEVQRAADKKAREAIAEEHRVRMIAAKEEAVERSKQVAAQRRTASLVNAARGKSRPSRSRQSTGESMDKRTENEYDERSTLEEGST